jgi:Cu-Zn family superoxide dismutase
VKVGDDGKLKIEVIATRVTLEKGAKNSLLEGEGTSLMIHEKPDDEVSDPAGNAGARIACGCILTDEEKK